MKDSAITNSRDREGSFEDSLGGRGPIWITLEKSRLFKNDGAKTVEPQANTLHRRPKFRGASPRSIHSSSIIRLYERSTPWPRCLHRNERTYCPISWIGSLQSQGRRAGDLDWKETKVCLDLSSKFPVLHPSPCNPHHDHVILSDLDCCDHVFKSTKETWQSSQFRTTTRTNHRQGQQSSLFFYPNNSVLLLWEHVSFSLFSFFCQHAVLMFRSSLALSLLE